MVLPKKGLEMIRNETVSHVVGTFDELEPETVHIIEVFAQSQRSRRAQSFKTNVDKFCDVFLDVIP